MTSLIASTDYWYENIDYSTINLTILLDLKKAFDTVDHIIFIQKLQKNGVKTEQENGLNLTYQIDSIFAP